MLKNVIGNALTMQITCANYRVFKPYFCSSNKSGDFSVLNVCGGVWRLL